MENHRFFQHTRCPYFPCHKTSHTAEFNCLFCFCPLYALGENCGGNFVYTENGIKDCSHCLFPHTEKNYDRVLQKISEIIEITKKKTV